MVLKRADELQPGDRIRMKIGHATVMATEPMGINRTMLTFAYGSRHPADNHVTVDVLKDYEGWEWPHE